ncbi:MAG: DinB family protein [Acidobacteria bacterium]|nr:DinB family protein [Acidobacteriota bacterium]
MNVRPAPSEYAPYFDRYISQVPDGPILGKLTANPLEAALRAVPDEAASLRPAPGKWSLKEVLGHVIDTERIMAARALRIARGDQTALPGFDQDPYVENADFQRRSMESLLEELQAVRAATAALFRWLPEEAWARTGTVSGNQTSVRALAWVIAGHELHHVNLLTRR